VESELRADLEQLTRSNDWWFGWQRRTGSGDIAGFRAHWQISVMRQHRHTIVLEVVGECTAFAAHFRPAFAPLFPLRRSSQNGPRRQGFASPRPTTARP
jgi:hypothetical protein